MSFPWRTVTQVQSLFGKCLRDRYHWEADFLICHSRQKEILLFKQTQSQQARAIFFLSLFNFFNTI